MTCHEQTLDEDVLYEEEDVSIETFTNYKEM